MEKLIIRQLRKEDIEPIKAIYALHWPDDEFRKKLGDRLESFISQSPDIVEQYFVYFVAENNNEVVGVVGLRKLPAHMQEFATTSNPCELYILAVKHPGNGAGKVLLQKAVQTAKEKSYTETILYSGETHQKSWRFYDRFGFERIGDSTAPNGEKGKVWGMKL